MSIIGVNKPREFDLDKLPEFNQLLPGFRDMVKHVVNRFFEQTNLPEYFFVRVSDWYRDDMTIEYSFVHYAQPTICSPTLSRYCSDIISIVLESKGYAVIKDLDLKHPFNISNDTFIAFMNNDYYKNLFVRQFGKNGEFWGSKQQMFQMEHIEYYAPKKMLQIDKALHQERITNKINMMRISRLKKN